MTDTSTFVEDAKLFRNDLDAFVNTVDSIVDSVTVEEALYVASQIDACVKDLRLVADELRKKVAAVMEAVDEKERDVTLPDGSNVKVLREWKVSRTQVQTDDLVGAVEMIARDAEFRLNKDTGELIDETESRLSVIRRAFRMEPRWSVIKELGISDDEYCQKRFQSTIKLEAGGK
jgi:hypothetical protein